MKRALALVAGLALGTLLPSCGSHETWTSGDIALRSPAFAPGETLPKRLASSPEGENVSPPLTWSGLPPGTKELALIVDDPDAPGLPFVHWVAYGIPASMTGLPEGASAAAPAAGGFVQGKNDFGKIGWGGPLPPAGDPPHRYAFSVYALDAPLGLEPGATKGKVIEAMKGHVRATGRLVGRYAIPK